MDKILTELGVLSYFIIFFAKIIEVSMSTVRIMFVAKGERVKAAFIAFFEILIWIVIVSSVLSNINEDPIRALVYCAAFAIGNYIGVYIESKLAVGLSSIQVITQDGLGHALADDLRAHGFGVTIIKGEGKDTFKEILLIHLKRRRIREAVDVINEKMVNAVVIVNEVKALRGGYIKK